MMHLLRVLILQDDMVRGPLVNSIHLGTSFGGRLRGVVVAGGAYYPSLAAQGYLVDQHAHGVVDLEASKRCDLRQCTALGALLIRRHQD
jgi:hypothetical protein